MIKQPPRRTTVHRHSLIFRMNTSRQSAKPLAGRQQHKWKVFKRLTGCLLELEKSVQTLSVTGLKEHFRSVLGQITTNDCTVAPLRLSQSYHDSTCKLNLIHSNIWKYLKSIDATVCGLFGGDRRTS